MNITNLKYFVSAAEELNFTKASKRMFVSQQCISEHIQKLESELQVSLFERTPHLRLTYAGQTLYSLAKGIQEIEQQITDQMRFIKDAERDRVSIGISYPYGRIILPEILPSFSQSYPMIEFDIVSNVTRHLEALLVNDKIDFIIGVGPFNNQIQTETLITEKFYMLVPRQYYVDVPMSQNKIPDFKLYQKAPFLLIKQGNRVRDRVDELFHAQKFTPSVRLECADTETVVKLAFNGMGITFTFEMYLQHYRNNSPDRDDYVHCLPIDTLDPASVVIAYKKNAQLRPAFQLFRKSVVEYFRIKSPYA